MKDSSKTNQELIAEISVLKKIIQELENSEAERKQAENALRESEERYRELTDSLPISISIFEVDATGNIISFNRTALEVFRYKEEDYKEGMNALQFFAPEEWQRVGENMGMVIQGTSTPGQEFTFLRKDGSKFIGLIYASPNIHQNKTVRIRGAIIDITERKQVEEKLRESEEKYRNILENIEDGYFEVDLAGNFTFFNPSLCRILGYPREEMPGMNNRVFMDAKNAKKVFRAFNEVYVTGIPRKGFEWETIRKDSARTYMEVSVSLIARPGEKPTGFRGIARDITERKQVEEEKRSLEERLQRAEKMEALGQLAGGVAHDLNNVLGILSGYSELLMEEIPEGSRSRGHAEKILQSTEKGAAIIQDLLTLARRGVMASDVINLNSVVSDFLKTPIFDKLQAYHPYVTFRTECDKNLLNIKGSPVHLEKALMNLVSNAAESISGKGEVTIRTESRYLDNAIRGYDEVKEGDYAVLTVSDTGMGIPAENREKIFEPFYTKKAMGRSGTGLGLAIVWGTVKDHHGYIDVQTKVGEGTTFTLYFPVTRDELIAQQQKVPMEQYMGKGESVLVVDDIAEQRDVAARLLTRLGYEVHLVSSGEDAVEYLKENKADILVMDMIMAPGIDDLETYRRVLQINPKQKAILVSGFSETERVRKAQKLGAGAYVKKPYIMKKIGVAIRNELTR